MNLTIFNAFNLLLWAKFKNFIAIFVVCIFLYTVMPYFSFMDSLYKYITFFLPFAAIQFTLAVFTYGDSATGLSNQSNFPTHFFTLPVSTATLIAWPMILGGLVMIFNWFLVDQLWLKPRDIHVAFWWPAIMAISMLFWFQIISWGQYPYIFISLFLTSLMIIFFIVIVFLIFNNQEKIFLIGIGLSLQLFIAWHIALKIVSRVRRGFIVHSWHWPKKLKSSSVDLDLNYKTHASSFQAQCYMESRLHGLILPGIAILMGSMLLISGLIVLLFGEDPQGISLFLKLAAFNLGLTLLSIYLLSMVWFNFYTADWYVYNKTHSMTALNTIPNFFSTLPMTNQDMIKAKFITFSRNVIFSFMIAMGFSLAMVSIYLVVSYPEITIPPVLTPYTLIMTFTVLLILVVLVLVLIILNSLSSMWFWMLRKSKFLWFVIPPIIMLAMVKEIWTDATFLELFFLYFPWLVGIVCTVKLIMMVSFLPWLPKQVSK